MSGGIDHGESGGAWAIEVRSLTHRYGDLAALDDVSFSVRAGEIFGLLGPNGSGKSTLFRILATLQRATSGTAILMGDDVASTPARVRRHLGVTFQSPALDRKLTVRENLRHHGHLYGLRAAALKRRISDCLEAVRLADRADERVERLSGGMRRRVELAKCMLHEPALLLMDEPSTGLDPVARRNLLEQVGRLRELNGMTCLLTTHLMDEAEGCARVGILDRGKLIALDTPERLKNMIGGQIITLTTDRPEELEHELRRSFSFEIRRIGSSLRVEHEDGHALAARIAQPCGALIASIAVSRPTLEDVFVRLTGHRLENGEVATGSVEGDG